MQRYSITSSSGWFVLAATTLASGFAFLFGSAVVVALPAIQADFDATLSGIQWIVNSFTLVLGVFILISGALSDRYGRKRIFLSGIAIFAFGLALSGFAPSLGWLIALQTISGLGAAMMVPSSLAIIKSCFEEGEMGRAIGIWAGFSTGIAAIGPFFGGTLVDLFSWRAVFLALVPLALLVFIAAIRLVPETKGGQTGTIDVWGMLAIALALFGILFGSIQGPELGWANPWVMGAIALGIAAFVAFIAIERRVENPIVPLEIFRSRPVLNANTATLLLYFVLGGTIFFVTLNLQQVQGLSSTLTGIAMLPPIVLIALLSGASGKLVDTFGARLPMIIGPMLIAASMVWMTFAGTNASYFIHFFPALVILGLGMALIIPALTTSALTVVGRYSGAASGINNAISRVAWLLAIAFLGAVASMIFQSNIETRLQSAPLPDTLVQEIREQKDRFGGIEIQTAPDAETLRTAERVVDEAFVFSFRAILLINTLLALLASLAAFLILRSRKSAF